MRDVSFKLSFNNQGPDLYLLINANLVTDCQEHKMEELVNLLYFLIFLLSPPYFISAICICQVLFNTFQTGNHVRIKFP